MRIFTLQNLGVAYRKGKVDLYYSRDASRNTIANKEQPFWDQTENLHRFDNGELIWRGV